MGIEVPIVLQNEIRNERNQSRVNWIHVSPGSVYAGEQIDLDHFLIGGSTWTRRSVPFTHELARNTPGIVYFLIVGDETIYSKQVEGKQFPSMVNSIIPLGDRVFVGCKHEEQAFNIITQDLHVDMSQNDYAGRGVYNAVYDHNRDEIIVVTRAGSLEYIDSHTLHTRLSIPLAPEGTRLWSVKKVGLRSAFVVGDYDGSVYLINEDDQVEKTVNLKEYMLSSMRVDKQVNQPSVFGLTILPDETVVAGVRWGQIMWFKISEHSFSPEKAVVLPWEISFLETVPDSTDILIGTREGKLLYLSDQSEGIVIHLLHEQLPSLQHDNSIWSISFTSPRSCIVCFADGQVVSLNI